jgi:hypothetical protein
MLAGTVRWNTAFAYLHGSVRLNASDRRASLHSEHGFLSHPDDASVVAEGVENAAPIVAAGPARRNAGPETRPGPEVDSMTHVRATARGFFTPSDLRDRAGGRRPRPRVRARRARCRRCVDPANDAAR